MTIDVVMACGNAQKLQLFMLDTLSMLYIPVKNCHSGFTKAPMDSISVAREEVLTTCGDIYPK